MRRTTLFSLLFASSVAFGCASTISPDNWVLNPESDAPISVEVMSVDGRVNLDLIVWKGADNLFQATLERPKEDHFWLFNSCQLKGKNDPHVLAVMHKENNASGPRWTTSLTAVYRLNFENRGIERIPQKDVRCFTSR